MNDQLYSTYLELLKEFITFKSVSTDPKFAEDIQKTASFLAKTLEDAGFNAEVITGYDNPLVLAHYEVDPKAQTVMIYGHYDVQPADKKDGWDNDPFEIDEKDGRIRARGAIDNKGQIMLHIASILDLIKNNKLVYNITFFVEGNEETGSPNLERFVEEYAEKLKADYIMISDGEIVGEHPIIEVGFRGVMNATVTLKTSHTELHSGLVGGSVPNAAHEMSRFLAGLHKDINQVQIPGFYDDVKEPTQEQLDNNASIPFDEKEYLRITGTQMYTTEKEYDLYTQTGLRPSLEVTGVHSGYTDTGYKNGVPPVATAKFNFRFVADQDPADIAEKFKKYVDDVTPEYVEAKVEIDESAKPVFLDITDPIFEKTKDMLEEVYEEKVMYKYVGGSIPIVGTFQDVLKAPQLLIPLANEDCNMHGVHENFRIDLAKKGLTFSQKFFSKKA